MVAQIVSNDGRKPSDERAMPSTRLLRWEDRERFFALANRSELYTGEPCYGRELAE